MSDAAITAELEVAESGPRPPLFWDAAMVGLQFGKSARWATTQMAAGKLPGFKVGEQWFSSGEMIGEWMAVEAAGCVPRPKHFDPLLDAVVDLAQKVIGRMIQEGQLQMVKGPAE